MHTSRTMLLHRTLFERECYSSLLGRCCQTKWTFFFLASNDVIPPCNFHFFFCSLTMVASTVAISGIRPEEIVYILMMSNMLRFDLRSAARCIQAINRCWHWITAGRVCLWYVAMTGQNSMLWISIKYTIILFKSNFILQYFVSHGKINRIEPVLSTWTNEIELSVSFFNSRFLSLASVGNHHLSFIY